MSLDKAITWRLEGQLQVQVALSKIGAAGRVTMIRVVARYALKLQAMARRAVKVDTGFLRTSILTEFFNRGLSAEIGSGQKTAVWIEHGTRPHWPPKGALLGWVRRHGMPDSAEFLVRRAIARRGTRARPFLLPAWRTVGPQYIEAAKADLKDAIREAARSN